MTKYQNNIQTGTITQNNNIITPYAILEIKEDTALIKTKGGHITTIPVTDIPEEIPDDILEQPKKTTKKQETKKEQDKKQ